MNSKRPVVLTIAGLDPSGGAGVIADIKTILSLDCFATAAITSLTFQNTTRVFGVENQSASTVRSQVEPVVADYEIAAVKTGMLPTAEVVAEVAKMFESGLLPAPVVDPVMVSTSGDDLIGAEAFQVMKSRLLPAARVITPNIPEAERLSGVSIRNEGDMLSAAHEILNAGVKAVLVKGGHRARSSTGESTVALDILATSEGRVIHFSEQYVEVGEVHGSGCTLSAAIAASLAHGLELEKAVQEAKTYVTQRMRSLLTEPRLGKGARPL